METETEVLTDHDLLIRIDERLKTVENNQENHLRHHFRYNLLAWTVALGALISLLIK